MSNNSQRNSVFNTTANSKVYHAQLKDIRQFTPEKINHLRRGGIRQGAGRNTSEMQKMLDKIPPSQRAGVDGQSAAHKVKEYLSDKDASHIKSHHQGGSNHSDNIKWENKSINRARGDRHMTRPEQIKLDVQAQFDNLGGALKAGIYSAPRGAAIGAITTLPYSALKNGLKVVRGEISTQEAAKETAKETGIGAGVGAVTALTITTVATACPPVAIALTAASPYLLGVVGANMIHQFFRILDEHKQQIKASSDSTTEPELKYLSHPYTSVKRRCLRVTVGQIEVELVDKQEKTISQFS
ncbi:MAG: hypothetical protein ACFCU5_06710 [Pleurocapsa sp.]